MHAHSAVRLSCAVSLQAAIAPDRLLWWLFAAITTMWWKQSASPTRRRTQCCESWSVPPFTCSQSGLDVRPHASDSQLASGDGKDAASPTAGDAKAGSEESKVRSARLSILNGTGEVKVGDRGSLSSSLPRVFRAHAGAFRVGVAVAEGGGQESCWQRRTGVHRSCLLMPPFVPDFVWLCVVAVLGDGLARSHDQSVAAGDRAVREVAGAFTSGCRLGCSTWLRSACLLIRFVVPLLVAGGA